MTPYFRIPLLAGDGTVRAHALVDGGDLDWILAYRWSFSNGYAVRTLRLGKDRSTKVRMHREIMGLARHDPREVDHINRNPLDNRRSNLRVVTSALNAQNKPSSRGSTSRFRGVCWDAAKGKWLAQAKLNGRNYHLGRFDSELDAARAASAWRKRHMPAAVEDMAA